MPARIIHKNAIERIEREDDPIRKLAGYLIGLALLELAFYGYKQWIKTDFFLEPKVRTIEIGVRILRLRGNFTEDSPALIEAVVKLEHLSRRPFE